MAALTPEQRRTLLAPTRDLLTRLTGRLEELEDQEAVVLELASEALVWVAKRRYARSGAVASIDNLLSEFEQRILQGVVRP